MASFQPFFRLFEPSNYTSAIFSSNTISFTIKKKFDFNGFFLMVPGGEFSSSRLPRVSFIVMIIIFLLHIDFGIISYLHLNTFSIFHFSISF